MSISRMLKWITGICEAFLGIPFFGGLYIVAHGWIPLVVMFFFHLITLLLTVKDRGVKFGSMLGMFTSIVGIIPVLGTLLHILTALVLFITGLFPDAPRKKRTTVI